MDRISTVIIGIYIPFIYLPISDFNRYNNCQFRVLKMENRVSLSFAPKHSLPFFLHQSFAVRFYHFSVLLSYLVRSDFVRQP